MPVFDLNSGESTVCALPCSLPGGGLIDTQAVPNERANTLNCFMSYLYTLPITKYPLAKDTQSTVLCLVTLLGHAPAFLVNLP
jgi:hypothetical protein